MKFDLTKEVSLSPKGRKKYMKLRATTYAIFLASIIFLAYVIIFPSVRFDFSFNPGDKLGENPLIDPRDSSGNALENGLIPDNSPAVFDATLFGNYSRVKVYVALDSDSDPLKERLLRVRKAHRAFLYPQGDSIGFKEGTLLRSGEKYFIVSDGKLRKFESQSVVRQMGFIPEVFWEASGEDLRFNQLGEIITDPNNFPNSSLFKVADTYYILKREKLWPYVSEQAFFSNYRSEQAISKDEAFLSKFEISSDMEGFSDGTLISYGVSAYVVSGGKIFPINNVNTFTSLGYAWEDIIPVSGDEFSLYPKDKLLTISSVHPDGTIFDVAENSDWRLAKNKKILPLPTELIARSWLMKKTPILVSKESLETYASCYLEERSFFQNEYGCEILLAAFENISGKDYEFELPQGENISLDSLQVTFKKNPTWENLKLAAKGLLGRVSANYVSR